MPEKEGLFTRELIIVPRSLQVTLFFLLSLCLKLAPQLADNGLYLQKK